jgi:putative PIN family toxin of toxin-antitoxin system
MRITPDTGILVRMNVRAKGPARRLLEMILAGPHQLVLSEFLLDETARALRYPRLQNLYNLSTEDIDEHILRLRERADLVTPVVYKLVVLTDPNDDPVVYTAVAGGTDVLCTLDRHFYAAEVVAFCRDRGIEVMNDVDLLRKLDARKPGEAL